MRRRPTPGLRTVRAKLSPADCPILGDVKGVSHTSCEGGGKKSHVGTKYLFLVFLQGFHLSCLPCRCSNTPVFLSGVPFFRTKLFSSESINFFTVCALLCAFSFTVVCFSFYIKTYCCSLFHYARPFGSKLYF